MDDPSFWSRLVDALVDALNPRTIVLSFIGLIVRNLAWPYIKAFFGYVAGWLLRYKVSPDFRWSSGRLAKVNVITIILLGRLFIEFVVWVK